MCLICVWKIVHKWRFKWCFKLNFDNGNWIEFVIRKRNWNFIRNIRWNFHVSNYHVFEFTCVRQREKINAHLECEVVNMFLIVVVSSRYHHRSSICLIFINSERYISYVDVCVCACTVYHQLGLLHSTIVISRKWFLCERTQAKLTEQLFRSYVARNHCTHTYIAVDFH